MRDFLSCLSGIQEVVRSSVACSKRSDSGERCGVEKAMKSRGGLGREVLPRFYFFALPFTLHRSPLSERLEQASSSGKCEVKQVSVYEYLLL